MRFRQVPAEESAEVEAELRRLKVRGKEHLRDLTPAEAGELLKSLASKSPQARRTVTGIRFPDFFKARIAGLFDVDFIDCDLTHIYLRPPRFGGQFSVEGCAFDSCVWEVPIVESWRITDSTFRKTRFSGLMRGRFVKAAFERCLFEDCVLPDSIKECVLRDVEFRARSSMQTGISECHLERVRVKGNVLARLGESRCSPLDLREAVVSGCTFNELRGLVLLPQALGNCVVASDVLKQMRDELFSQLSMPSRKDWDLLFHPSFTLSDYYSIGPSMLKPFSAPEREVIQRMLLERSISEIRVP